MEKTFFQKYPFSYYLITAVFLILMLEAVFGLIGISIISQEKNLQDNAQSIKVLTENDIIAFFKSKEETIDPSIASFRYSDEDFIMQMKRDNPYLENVRIFDTTFRQWVNDTPIEINDPALREILGEVLVSRSTRDIADQQSGITQRYLFIDLSGESDGSDRSRIIELTYTDQPIRRALASSALYNLSFGVVVLLCCGFLAILTIWTLTRPIGMMMEDVNKIADGDLDHTITKPFGFELSLLGESINTMVTRLKDLIRHHQLSEKRFMDVVELLPQGVFETDTSGTVTYANHIALRSFQLTHDDIRKGVSVFDLLTPGDRGPAQERFRNIMQGEQSSGMEVTGFRKDGTTFPIIVYTTAIREGETSVGSRGGFIDITHLKNAEAEIRKLNLELEQRVTDRTQQLIEVNQNLESFTYSIAHDLRAPLRAISGFSSIMMLNLQNIPEMDKKYLGLIQQNAHEMGHLIDDLLSFSRLGRHSLKKKMFLPSSLIHEVIRDLRNEMDLSKVDFRVGDLPICEADPVLMRQVWVNLLTNAIKFSRTRDDPMVEIGSFVEEGNQVYFVRDNGIGFDIRYANKLFGVFERLHVNKEYEGTGIGLAIVKRIVELHGGKIWVESEVDKGATFYFTCG